MKTVLIIIGIIAIIGFLLFIYALCLVSKSAEIMEGIINETHEDL